MRICGGKEKRKLQVIAHITENDTLLAEEEINAKGMLELYLKAAGQRAEFFVRDEEGKVLKLIKDVSFAAVQYREARGFNQAARSVCMRLQTVKCRIVLRM